MHSNNIDEEVLHSLRTALHAIRSELYSNKNLSNFNDTNDTLSATQQLTHELNGTTFHSKTKYSPTDSRSEVFDLSSSHLSRKIVIFTMDSIGSYESESKSGGAAGELIIRHSLEYAFHYFNATYKILRSDSEFDHCNLNEYDIIILDPWTWAAKGWVPKKSLIGQESKIYFLDFFGSQKLKGSGMKVPLHRHLTAFGSPWNTFLGYHMPNDMVSGNDLPFEKTYGVIWGKDPKHFEGQESILKFVADKFPLISTSTKQVFSHHNIKWIGHLGSQSWLKLLRNAKFLIGLGNPILGPSAIDAISLGCVYINPIFSKPIREIFHSQHPYAEINLIDEKKPSNSRVCSFHQNNKQELEYCIQYAIHSNFTQMIPYDFRTSIYLKRVQEIFKF
eukprot:gene4775-6697_t